MHAAEQLLELMLVEDTNSLGIDLLELVGELAEEVFVLRKLTLEDDISELGEAHAALKPDLLALGILLLSRQLAGWLHAADEVVEVGARVEIGDVRLIDTTGEEVCAELVLFRLSLSINQILHLLV